MQTPASALPVSRTGDAFALTRPHLFECRDCGQLQQMPAVPPGAVARCRRCDAVLRRTHGDPFGLPMALILTAFLLAAIAGTTTLMAVSTAGIHHRATLFTGPEGLDSQGFWQLALLVAFTTIGAPLFLMGCLFYVMLGARVGLPLPYIRVMFGWIERMRPWAMVDVYLLGLFVAYVKLQILVRIELGPAFYALCALMLVMIALAALVDPEAIWEALDRCHAAPVPEPASESLAEEITPWAGRFSGCHVCGQVSRVVETPGTVCPRCAAPLHRRKRDAIVRTWALLLASAILYLPANIYPVLTVVRLGAATPSTILGGVEELVTAGQWPLALLVFVASVMVPVLKLAGLTLLLISVQRRWKRRLRDRTVLYRVVNTIGRWSMVDIFMESLLVGLVQFGKLTSIATGYGAIAFASVVVLTMFAAEAFDPRLIWDAAGANPDE